MKKTYITVLPDHFGAFLKANRCFEKLGINITRVSYNKAIDSHTLFIDAEGTKEQLEKADIELKRIGYLENQKKDPSVCAFGIFTRKQARRRHENFRAYKQIQF